ncbi:Nitrogen assimilation transcription factor nirA, partial [Penicillium rolfsii]
PTNQRIEQLEQENAILRQQCARQRNTDIGIPERLALIPSEASLASLSPAQSRVTGSISYHAEFSPSDHHSNRDRDGSHPEVPDSDNHRHSTSLYHGPTSTVYDDTAHSGADGEELEVFNSPVSEEWARHLLFAQTARQRQLEPLNLAAGKLDFDGLDPELGMHLLTIYWSRQLYTAQITYRPVFMRDMACNGPYFSKLLLNAILFTVSKHCPRPELRSDPDDITTAGWRFRQRFTELLRESFDKSEITTLQALIIMSNSLFSRCDERSLSWLYAGNAFNMIIDLGLHVLPSPNKMSAEELEVRKRVIWGAYTIDKIQCLLQGRPPLLRQVNFKASLNFLDEYDELDTFKDITYSATEQRTAIPSLNVSLLTKLCELSIISERILCELYSESQNMSESQSQKISADISSDLSKWRSSLPPQLDYISYPRESVLLPQAFCLLALSCVLTILSQRPLFLGSHPGRTRNSAAAYEAVSMCTAAANQIVQILRDYSQHFSITSAPYMLSYATYISATIHVRIVAQKGRGSNSFQCLLLCRKVLREHLRLYAAAGKAMANLEKLVAHLGIVITEGDETGSSTISIADDLPAQETIHAPHLSNTSDQTIEIGSPQLNWGLSDLDLEAIAQSFRLDTEMHYLMHPIGI